MSREQGLTDEQSRCLAKVYRLLLALTNEHKTTDGGEFSDMTPSVADDAPPTEDRHNDTVHQKHEEGK